MKIIEVEARSKLIGFCAIAEMLTSKQKRHDALLLLAAEIFDVPPTDSMIVMAERVSCMGKQKRRKRCLAYREKMVARRKAELFKPSPHPVQRNNSVRRPAPEEAKIRDFYASWEWKRLSFDVKLDRGRKCECCGARAPEVRITTDHIKPIRHYWHLRLERTNLQVLCDDCNMGKGSRNETDFRAA